VLPREQLLQDISIVKIREWDNLRCQLFDRLLSLATLNELGRLDSIRAEHALLMHSLQFVSVELSCNCVVSFLAGFIL